MRNADSAHRQPSEHCQAPPGARPPRPYLVCAILCLACLFVFTAGSQAYDFWNPDEPREAEIAREMMAGSRIVPHFNGAPFLEKPPLFYWMLLPVMHTFGPNEWAMRMLSVLAATVCVLATFLFAARECGTLVGAASGALLASSFIFWFCARRCLLDMTLAAFLTVALIAWHAAHRRQSAALGMYALSAVALACALLAKGLIAFVLFGSSVAVYLIVRRDFRLPSWLCLAAICLFSLPPLALWLFALYREAGADALHVFLYENHVGRFLGRQGSHPRPFHYYLYVLPLFSLPGSLLIPYTASRLVAHLREHGDDSSAHPLPESVLFALCWAGGQFVALSIPAGKREIYLLPLLPGLCVALGWGYGQLCAALQSEQASAFTRAMGVVLIASAPATCACAVGAPSLVPFLPAAPMSVAGAAILVFGFKTARALRKRSAAWHYWTAASLIVAYLCVGAFVFPSVNRLKGAKAFCGKVLHHMGADGKICMLLMPEGTQGQFLFYMGRTVRAFEDAEEAAGFLDEGGKAYCLMRGGRRYEHHLHALERQLPLRVVARERIGSRTYILVKGCTEHSRSED